MDLYFGKKTY